MGVTSVESHAKAASKCACVGFMLLLLLPGMPLGFPAGAGSSHDPRQLNPRLKAADRPPALASSPSAPVYDEQLGITFTRGFTSLAYNVTAIIQQESNGYGPAYLLNGLSDKGYWYQVGVSWDWCGPTSGTCTGYVPGFNFIYEVFDNTGVSVDPAGGGGGLRQFSGSVNQGDLVLLNLYFSNGDVVMNAYDWNTKASAFETYASIGATQFVGLASVANTRGFFTGLMTEWYHQQPYFSNVQTTEYSDPAFQLASAYMWIDEFNSNTSSILFNQESGEVLYTQPGTFISFSSNGATEYSNAFEFVTGPLLIDLTLSYSVVGGGVGLTPPSLTYQSNGQTYAAPLGTAPTTFAVDFGTIWSVTNPLNGSTSGERWYSSQPVVGRALASETQILVYDHQYTLTVTGGGSGGAGWYDSGARVTRVFNYVWSLSENGSRYVVSSLSVDRQARSLSGSVSGNFSLTFVMSSAHEVVLGSTRQYRLETSGGKVLGVFPGSPTNDTWFDSGTALTIQAAYTWDLVAYNSRLNLASYSLDGVTTPVPRESSGAYNLTVQMGMPHNVTLSGQLQYFIWYSFWDASESVRLRPDAFNAGSTGSLQAYNSSSFWADDSGTVTISGIVWNGVDVSPAGNLSRVVTGPGGTSVLLRVYDTKVVVTDPLGLAVGGASVSVHLTNGSVVTGSTDADGAASVGLVPAGGYQALVSYLGIQSSVSADASALGGAHVQVLLSYPILGIMLVSVVVVASGVFLLRRKRKKGPSQATAGQALL